MNTVTQIALMLAGCFVAYLLLCAVVVLRTGSTDGLPAVGAAVAAFIAAVIGLIRRWPGGAGVEAAPQTRDAEHGDSSQTSTESR